MLARTAAALRPRLAAGRAACAALALGGCFASSSRAQEPETPAAPGLVRFGGGRTAIGTDLSIARKWLAEGGSADIAAETPRHEVQVAPFELMVTEVSNEQFEAYVRATGSRPPLGWAKDALQAAQAAHVAEQMRRRTDASGGASGNASAGTPGGAPANAPTAFQPAPWWDEHWRESSWQLDPEHAPLPVTQIDWEDAAQYAHWAGLRLMTEHEFQHAGRAGGRTNYAWGEAFDARHAATWERGVARVSPIGSFPSGCSRDGLYDLCGNVREWTRSEWTPYPGFRPVVVEGFVGGVKQSSQHEPSWDIGWRVAVGGAFGSRRVDARLAARSGYSVDERRADLGFRCARAVEPGADRIAWWNERWLGPDARRAMPRFEPRAGLCAERWSSRVPLGRPRGYALIERYDALYATPIDRVDAGSKKSLEALAQAAGGTLLVGAYEATFALRNPALGAQTCLLAWRPRPPIGAVERGPFGRTIPASSGTEELLFLDRNGDYLARIVDVPLELERTPERASTRVADPRDTGLDGSTRAVATRDGSAVALLRFPFWIRSSLEDKSFVARVSFELEAAALVGSWRGLEP